MSSAAVLDELVRRLGFIENRLAHLETAEYIAVASRIIGLSTVSGIRTLFIPRKQTVDVTATTVFTVTTTNETGDVDAGSYSCYVLANIAHADAAGTAYSASKAFLAAFTRAKEATGTGVNSAVTEICETASAATSSPNRDIGTVTMTVLETSEYVQGVQFYVQCTGTSGSNPFVTCWVVLVHSGFTTPPTLAAA